MKGKIKFPYPSLPLFLKRLSGVGVILPLDLRGRMHFGLPVQVMEGPTFNSLGLGKLMFIVGSSTGSPGLLTII